MAVYDCIFPVVYQATAITYLRFLQQNSIQRFNRVNGNAVNNRVYIHVQLIFESVKKNTTSILF
jgi:hypothetical protein